jgi:isopentenyl-diphosphate delta-isomerase type 1
VVLLDERGRPRGYRPKASAHTRSTPLHLAFSCHVVNRRGEVLLARRAFSKTTWPGTWSNGCCGHPQLGESLRDAVTRRLGQELGVVATHLALAVPDFAYRAEMDDGVVEHELCPVVVALVDHEPTPDPAEVAEVSWVPWGSVLHRAERDPASLSPWCVAQVRELFRLAHDPFTWLVTTMDRPPHPSLDDATSLTPEGRLSPKAPPAAAASSALGPIQARLPALLDGFLADRRRDLTSIDQSLAAVADEVRALVDAGGKRLRPAFVHWGHRATGAPDSDEALRAAGAVELLHTFALLHDDVMDRSAVRRGRPSAHAAFAADHAGGGRSGDAAWFGTSAAVLAGDLTFVWADQLFDSIVAPPEAHARAREVFTALRAEVIAGQYLDLRLASDPAAHEEQARRVAVLKSARYTVTRPLLLGAALAPEPVPPTLLGALSTYGDAVGLAFQMRDDVLGLFGDPAETGKSDLDDLREGKRTLLLLRARRLTTPAGRRLLDAHVGRPDLDEAQAARIREVVADSGALASVEALVSAEHALAVAVLDGVPHPARVALEELAGLAIERSS